MPRERGALLLPRHSCAIHHRFRLETEGHNGTQLNRLLAGCSSLNYGHSDPDMKAALIDQIALDGVAHGLDLHTDAKAAFLGVLETQTSSRVAWITG